jgi:hypothetical protein
MARGVSIKEIVWLTDIAGAASAEGAARSPIRCVQAGEVRQGHPAAVLDTVIQPASSNIEIIQNVEIY